ncbi:hypothetical protein HC028_03270 [Planosporangium flavigriseum]|uniref:Uncharacterized protein n=1 Tax=Planosporangium flavigriseum TaxID=373681 RepID=A0A8J3LIB8_9ACTN|nr:hypothetical protein [Planosporangium flavigriseum]NJC63535.1 hypothetical protein [Planosporangium flavigriseum]GIG72232.1 hypothetical protein Pfl04_06360 [Planosporangium flavigriseum]
MSAEEEQPVAEFELDPELVDAFVEGKLDADGEAKLADQVARLLPLHWTVPPEITGAMQRIIDRLGGDRELLAWLERHPGRPRLVARLYVLIGLLDQISDEESVVDALRELRDKVPYPPGLEGYLLPDTTPETLADLSAKIEGLLADDRTDQAFRLAVAAVAMLQEIAPRAARADSELSALGDVLEQIRRDLIAAAAGK